MKSPTPSRRSGFSNSCRSERRVRGAADGEYEARMAGMNHLLMPEVETVLMPAAEDFRFVSSSFVREVARLGKDEYERFVDPRVIPFLRDALGR